jgi:uncharacterized protein YdaU (DUF1376 family)
VARTKDGKPDAWMPVYIGETIADTAHLTARQFGAYMRLRLAAWRRGGALPGQTDQLRALTGLDPDAWRDDWPVLSGLFTLEDGAIRDPALEERYAHAVDRYAKRVASSAAGVAARAGRPTGAPDGKPNGAPNDVPNGTPNGEQNQNQSHKKPKSPLVPPSASRFPEFWAAYPRASRKGKADALKRWTARGLDAIADRILADVVERAAKDRQWREGFIPHASTYVNGQGWEDAIDDTPPKVATLPNGRPEPVHNPGGSSPPVVETPQRKLDAMRAMFRQQVDLGLMTEAAMIVKLRPYEDAARAPTPA